MDPESYAPDASLLAHDTRLAVRTLQTQLLCAAAWCLDHDTLAELEKQLQSAKQELAKHTHRLNNEIERKTWLASIGTRPKNSRKAKLLDSPAATGASSVPADGRALKRVRATVPPTNRVRVTTDFTASVLRPGPLPTGEHFWGTIS